MASLSLPYLSTLETAGERIIPVAQQKLPRRSFRCRRELWRKGVGLNPRLEKFRYDYRRARTPSPHLSKWRIVCQEGLPSSPLREPLPDGLSPHKRLREQKGAYLARSMFALRKPLL